MVTRDSEIPAIFNPKKVRAPPPVVVTGDSPNGPFGSFTNCSNPVPHITHSDSVTSSQHDGQDSLIGITVTGCETPTSMHHPLQPASLLSNLSNNTNNNTPTLTSKHKGCKESCCSELAQKVSLYLGSLE